MSVKSGLKREYVVFFIGMLLILLTLSRYIVNGEPVDIRSEITEETIALSDGMEIVQPLSIPEGINWRQGYYALFFSASDRDSAGEVICTLQQGERQETQRILLKEITAGQWMSLERLYLNRLESGEAELSVCTEGVAAGELEVAVGPDYYGFGNFILNGEGQQAALAQAYHYHITGTEYKFRLLCYGVTVLCAAALSLLVGSPLKSNLPQDNTPKGSPQKGNLPQDNTVKSNPLKDNSPQDNLLKSNLHTTETHGKCLAAFGILTVMFLAVIYLLDSSIYLEPTYAEAVTNFLRFAREEGLTENLLITDAGYLPLLPRLITLFYVKVLRVPSTSALYFMQGTACLLCSMVWSFFVLRPFRGLMCFSNRILLCTLVMVTCFCEETIFFTNHAYWGIFLLLLLTVADLEEFPGWIYAGLMAVSALVCLSKGTYAVMLPLMVLYLIFFRKSIGRRNKVYACVVGAVSMLQLLYSFSGQGDGGSWIDVSSMSRIGYWLRLAGRTFVEFGAYMLTPLGEAVQQKPVLVIVLAVASFLFLAAGFVSRILLPAIRGERIGKQRVAFYTVVMFQLIVSAFFHVTVKPVPDSWGKVGRIALEQMGSKYEIFSNMGFYMLFVTGGALLMAGNSRGQKSRARGLTDFMNYEESDIMGRKARCHDYGVLVLILLFCLTNPVMKLSGWADAGISDGRVYEGDINAGWQECREMISESSFFFPVRNDNWAYSHNINLYQVGADTYFEETSCRNLEETAEGYHSFYEIKDEIQSQNVIEVMINRPLRVDQTAYRVRLLDAEGKVLAETGQLDSGRNKKCLFRFDEPVSGVRTIQFTDDTGNPVFYKDYIAWACAW